MTPDQLKAAAAPACAAGLHPASIVQPLPDGSTHEECRYCGATLVRGCEPDDVDDQCIADDSTECDCPRCFDDQVNWERDQGWGDDDYSDDDLLDGPCIGADCLHHDPMHSRAECFTEEQARAFYAGERAPKRAARRVRMARKRRRGWA